MDPKKQLDDAAVYDAKNRLRGYNAIGPNGQNVLIHASVLGLKADPERGAYITGLKPGWKLVSKAAPKADPKK